MIPGHEYISRVIPPEDKILFAVSLLALAICAAYLLIRVIITSGDFQKEITGDNK
jgi:hypothetical protein